MPTTVTSKVGATNTPTTMDYSTLQAWEDACPANLVTDDKIWRGECYDQGKFTAGINIGGQTVDATRYVELTCAAGASFKDKSGVRTTALTYNATTGSGVAIEPTSGHTFTRSISYCRFTGLQAQRSGYQYIFNGGGNATFDSCIIDISNRTETGISGSIASTDKFNNCLFLRGASAVALDVQSTFNGCTFVQVSGSSSGTAIWSRYNSAILKNCAVFGFATLLGGGTLASGTDYNASDLSSFGTGTHNQTSLTFVDQFESTTVDFRAKSSGSLDLNGTPDTTNIPTDISGTTRDAVNPTIGAWEVLVNATSFTVSGDEGSVFYSIYTGW